MLSFDRLGMATGLPQIRQRQEDFAQIVTPERVQFGIQTGQSDDALQHLPAAVNVLLSVEMLLDGREVDPVHKILLRRDSNLIFHVCFCSPPHKGTYQITQWGWVADVEGPLHQDVPPKVNVVGVCSKKDKQPKQICQNKNLKFRNIFLHVF